MNMKRTLVGAMFAIVGSAALLMGCPPPTDQSCTFDSDCDFEGDVCIEQQCVVPCDSDEDCSFDDVCVERSTGGVSICEPPASQGCTDHNQCADDELCNFETNVCEGDAPDCTDNSDCDEANGAFCNETTGTCENPTGSEYRSVRIHDVGTERCEDMTYGFITGGTKLMSVILLEDNVEVGYGDWLSHDLGENAEGNEPEFAYPNEILDGTAPSFGGRCPDVTESQSCLAGSSCQGETVRTNFRDDAVAALGCGGEVYLQFKDTDGNPINIENGMEIEVNEYGTFCSEEFTKPVDEGGPGGNHSPQSGEDAYDVYICTDTGANVDINTCDKINIGAAFGFNVFEIVLE